MDTDYRNSMWARNEKMWGWKHTQTRFQWDSRRLLCDSEVQEHYWRIAGSNNIVPTELGIEGMKHSSLYLILLPGRWSSLSSHRSLKRGLGSVQFENARKGGKKDHLEEGCILGVGRIGRNRLTMKNEGYVFAMICSSNVNRSMAAHDLLRVLISLFLSLPEK